MKFNADLVDDLARKKAVLFVGSGVSASAKTRAGHRIRTWGSFLQEAAKSVASKELKDDIERLIKESDYLLAAELLKDALDDQWPSLLRKEFAQVAGVSELHRAIVRLGQRILITTNFDKLLENAWNDVTVDATHYPRLITRLDSDVFKPLRNDENCLVKLHGTIDDDSSLVFTKSSYTERAYGNWVYTELVNTLLLNYTFIFIGFSMSDPAVSLLVELHAQRFPATRPHYIFLPTPISPQMIDVSKRLRRLYVLPYSPAKNHHELLVQVRELGDQVGKRRSELQADTLATKSATVTAKKVAPTVHTARGTRGRRSKHP
ncbi:SIR2 family protein [Corallococcus interemptor]|uniref:SIR2 family protein n=1 Tax=Corallococcus interemptor TaxID=2316720 RepID=UPI003CFE81F5